MSTEKETAQEQMSLHLWRIVGPFLLPMFGALAGGVSAYLAIKIDLAELRTRVDHVEKETAFLRDRRERDREK